MADRSGAACLEHVCHAAGVDQLVWDLLLRDHCHAILPSHANAGDARRLDSFESVLCITSAVRHSIACTWYAVHWGTTRTQAKWIKVHQ